MKFRFKHYNEFKDWVRWHDYFALVINEFHILTIRRYDFMRYENDKDVPFPLAIMMSSIWLTVLGMSFTIREWEQE